MDIKARSDCAKIGAQLALKDKKRKIDQVKQKQVEQSNVCFEEGCDRQLEWGAKKYCPDHQPRGSRSNKRKKPNPPNPSPTVHNNNAPENPSMNFDQNAT